MFGPEITPYFDTFHKVIVLTFSLNTLEILLQFEIVFFQPVFFMYSRNIWNFPQNIFVFQIISFLLFMSDF